MHPPCILRLGEEAPVKARRWRGPGSLADAAKSRRTQGPRSEPEPGFVVRRFDMARGRKPLTPAQAAARLELSLSQVQRFIVDGTLPSFKTPNGRRWALPDDVDALKRARTQPATEAS